MASRLPRDFRHPPSGFLSVAKEPGGREGSKRSSMFQTQAHLGCFQLVGSKALGL